MMSRGWLLLGAAGMAVMVVASAWAPLQPEPVPLGRRLPEGAVRHAGGS